MSILCGAFLACGTSVHAQQLAFPSAEGWGRFAEGGRGGTAIKVTNLNDSGAGSLRACLDAAGARTCIFDVSGIIDSSQQEKYVVTNGNLTIAGQTAPGEGILLQGYLQIDAPDVIIRHMRVRPGTDVQTPASWRSVGFGINAFDGILDHSSLGWATDDTMNACTGGRITLQWNIIAEGFTTDQHGKGGLICDGVTQVSILHNLYAHLVTRTPYFSSGDHQMINNVLYSITANTDVGPHEGAIRIEFINNYYLKGPRSLGFWSTSIRNLGPCWGSPGCDWILPEYAAGTSIYVEGNYHSSLRPNDTFPEASLVQQGEGGWTIVSQPYGTFPIIPSQTTALQARVDVLANVGARVPFQEPGFDVRILDDVVNGTGSTSDPSSPSGYGGYPTIPFVQRAAGFDTDGDGMPDTWETAWGLDPGNAADGPAIHANGYSNLENYLNELAGDTLPAMDEPPPMSPGSVCQGQ